MDNNYVIEKEELYGRGIRYDIVVDGDNTIFSDVSEAEIDRLCEMLDRKGIYDSIEVVNHVR